MAPLRPFLTALLAAGLGLSESAAHPMLDAQLARAEGALAAAPSDPRAWHRVAQLHRWRRHWDEAEAAFARARALPGAPSELDLDLGRMRLEQGRPEDALVPLSRYIAAHPEDPEGWDARGRALEKTRPEESAAALATALARSASTRPALPDTYLHWARAAEAAGTPASRILAGLDEGAARLQGAIALRMAALDLAERHGLVEEALARLSNLEADAHRKEPWAARRARLLAGAGRTAEAREAWSRVLAVIDTLPPSRQDSPALLASSLLHAETVLVQAGASCRYRANSSNPGIGTTWTAEGFADGSWPSGTYGVGYETSLPGALGLIATAVPSGTVSIYTRARFTVADPAQVTNLFLGADWDDGYIAWINGVEVYRSPQMPAGTPAWNSVPASHESSNGASPNYGSLVDVSTLGVPALHAGTNVLAIGVWNTGSTSSDLVLVPKLVMNRSGAAVARGPYLQRGTPTSVVVRWRTDVPTSSRVRYGTSAGNLNQQVSDAVLTTEHVLTLSGLTPETRYLYQVGSTAGDLAGDAFVTPPPAGTARPLRVWVLGDSGTDDGNQGRVRDAFQSWTGSRDPDFWLMLGDNAYLDGTDLEYQAAVFDAYPQTLRRSVLWPTLGNHDGHSADSSTQTGPYYDMFTLPSGGEAGGRPSGTEAYYSFDWSDLHVVVLDSYETDRSPGSAMLAWLEQDLEDTLQDWIVAVWHHPPYTKGSHDSDLETELIEMRENVVPILEAHGVDLMLSGHSHSYERSYLIDGHYGDSGTFGPQYLVDAGTGRPGETGPYEKPALGSDPHQGAVYAVAGSSGQIGGGALDHPAMLVSLSVLGSLVLDVSGNRLDATFLDDHGAVRDSFSLIKAPATLPVADFRASPVSGPAPLSVTFTDRSVNGPRSWSWDFENDGIVDSSAQHPQRTYTTPGLFGVKETVTNVAGSASATRSRLICVTGSGAPGAVTGLRFDANRTTVRWNAHPRGGSYDVVRGNLSALRTSGGSYPASSPICAENDGTDLTANLLLNPAPGQALYVLVRAVECNGTIGTWNDAGTNRDPGLVICP
ncbi:MAG TPA: metallophosphoesterase [Candidatus Polarisedimenticolaceae bacterium]|nr:metallophosphoesterase [Candidatus Polarisedimenticolaceae bacterium]